MTIGNFAEEGLLKNNLKLIVLVVLAVVSIGVYCIPGKQEKVPTRVLLDNLGEKSFFPIKRMRTITDLAAVTVIMKVPIPSSQCLHAEHAMVPFLQTRS